MKLLDEVLQCHEVQYQYIDDAQLYITILGQVCDIINSEKRKSRKGALDELETKNRQNKPSNGTIL